MWPPLGARSNMWTSVLILLWDIHLQDVLECFLCVFRRWSRPFATDELLRVAESSSFADVSGALNLPCLSLRYSWPVASFGRLPLGQHVCSMTALRVLWSWSTVGASAKAQGRREAGSALGPLSLCRQFVVSPTAAMCWFMIPIAMPATLCSVVCGSHLTLEGELVHDLSKEISELICKWCSCVV